MRFLSGLGSLTFPFIYGHSLLEEVGEALGEFLMIDKDSYQIYHSTYARILVNIDVSKGLLAEIEIESSLGSWVHPLDFEGILFRCRKCFQTGHVVARCETDKKKKRSASWWKGASSEHYFVKKKSFSQVVAQVPQAEPLAAASISGVALPQECVDACDGIPNDRLKNVGSSSLVDDLPASQIDAGSLSDSSISVVPASPNASYVPPSDGRSSILDPSSWQKVVARVEEGWITVKSKKI